MDFLAMLAEIFDADEFPEDARGRITEAYEFERDLHTETAATSDNLNNQLTTDLAAAQEALTAATGELTALKALKFDQIMNGDLTPGGDEPNPNDDNDDEPAEGPVGIDAFIESARGN